MKTNFTYDLDSLKRINGAVASDLDVAEKAAIEIEELSKSLSKKIKDFAELRHVMTLSDEILLKDAVTSLRHLNYELNSLCQFFSQSSLINYFDPARVRVASLVKDAEKSVESLLKHVYR